ncbi:hypothetical protein [Phenylobacterium sp.]|uniref:hypothetical protein n=1 Tax=Phenylobacterium sp. TaxID=1871053 RepID=UPI002727F4B3|nr:hypothetical protein [Phenylobacterium sp.]MDO8380496.1 hypothetical protein [Phenylobacterium sp.]
MSRTAHLARLERARLLTLEQRGKARAEALAVTAGVAETVALSEARGAAIEAPASPRKPHRRQAGLDWLVRQGRLNDLQKRAGERYGTYYRRARGGAGIGSSLDIKHGDNPQGTSLTEVLAQAEARVAAATKLAAYRRRLHQHPVLLAACDLVCGEELTPREAARSDREAGRLEAVLEVALDLLAAEAG